MNDLFFPLKYLFLIVSVAIVLSVGYISFIDDTIHYKGSKWMDEREALDLVLENDGLGDDFEIIGEGNSVELKYNFYTDDKLENFERDTDSWWDKNGINLFLIISASSFTIFVCMMIKDWLNNYHSGLLKKAKHGKG